MKAGLCPLTMPMLTFLLASIVLLNTAGFPFCQNPARHPFTAYGGNDFGWPFTYLSTNFTESQWQQTQLPDGGYVLPAHVAVRPTELFFKQDVVTFSGTALVSNVAAWCVMLLYAGVVLELWQRQCRRPPPFTWRILLVLVGSTCLIAVLSRSGTFHRWYYLQYYRFWALGEQLLAVAALCLGAALVGRYALDVLRRKSYQGPNAK